jgi:hypothetical protein
VSRFLSLTCGRRGAIKSDSGQYSNGSGGNVSRRYPDDAERAHAALSRPGGSTSFGLGPLFLYPDFSGAGGQNPVFMIKVWYLMVKVGLHKGFPLMYCTRGGSRRLLLKIGPQW